MNDVLNQLAKLADARHVVRLGYRRPGELAASEYLIEPYRLHRFATGPVVHGWQVSPVPQGRAPWRDFRLDRISSVDDTGQTFEPRIPITISNDAVGAHGDALALPPLARWSDQAIESVGPAEEYFRALEAAILDGQVTPEEMSLSQELSTRIEPQERKSVHARIFASVLHEVVEDGRISHREEIYLQKVRELLSKLGWAP